MRKTLYLLNVDGFAPQVTELTYPLLYAYARKIRADVYVIKERKFPTWPVVYEKLQLYELIKEHKIDWAVYFDSDTLIHPETVDFTELLPRDTVAHHGVDMASIRWVYDEYFRRDGRHIGSCNWCTIASSWCRDLWHPLDDLTLAQALENINPTVNELNTIITPEHLIDDYVLSRNIAKYGLKFVTLISVMEKLLPGSAFFYHEYTLPITEKVERMKSILEQWKLPKRDYVNA